MSKWVMLDSHDNIERFLDELPKNFKNVSNFISCKKPWNYGIYKYVEVKPVFDQDYEFLNQYSKIKTEDTLTITYVVEQIPVINARQLALAKIEAMKNKALMSGVLFEENIYRATNEESNLIMTRLLAAQSGYIFPDSFCWPDITGKPIPFSKDDLTRLSIEILKYRDSIDNRFSSAINSIYEALTTNDVKDLVNKLDQV